ncbi:MAG: hypothetical protein ACLUQN_02000 [Megasphaera sp.]
MIITRETDYAIRILRALADWEQKNIREISDEQMIPLQFAYKICWNRPDTSRLSAAPKAAADWQRICMN